MLLFGMSVQIPFDPISHKGKVVPYSRASKKWAYNTYTRNL
jgi:hypothetical protein